jgi:ABC-2 type transport system ATP-binding protein
MIEVRDLRRSYGETEALKGIGFSIRRGEVVGLLGPNGAGKTTAMRILVGALLPSAGRAEVAGFDVCEHPLEVQRRVGYLPENAPVYHDMLVQDYLGFTARMRGLDAAALGRGLARVVEECSIRSVLTRPVGHLSKGFRQRVGLAAALLHDPEILILDEPTGGLDPNQIMEVRELITRMGKTKTIILSTHILPEVEASCDRAVILIDGRVRADGSLGELTRSLVQVVSVRPDDAARAGELFGALDNVIRVESSGDDDGYRTFRLSLNRDVETGQAVAEIARERGWPIRELRRDDRSLEQVFRELTETAEEVGR